MNLENFLGYFDFTYEFYTPDDQYEQQLRQKLIEAGDLDPALKDKTLIALIDLQGAYLGDIGDERYPLDAKSVPMIMDRMEIYIQDSVISEFVDALEDRGIDTENMSLSDMIEKCKELGVGDGEVSYVLAEAVAHPDSVYIEELQGHDAALRLAGDLAQFAKDYDTYEYKDVVDDHGALLRNTADMLESGNADDFKQYLNEFACQGRYSDSARAAMSLMTRINMFVMAQEALSAVDNQQQANPLKAAEITDTTVNKAHCDWIIERAKELKALLSYNSESMIVNNKTRALSAIDTMMSSLSDLKLYITELEAKPSLDSMIKTASNKAEQQSTKETRGPDLNR